MNPPELIGVDALGIAHYKVPAATNPEPGDGKSIHLYVVYGPNTSDFPGKYLIRRQVAKNNRTIEIDEEVFAFGDSLEDVRKKVPTGKHRLERDPSDDPVILETWL